MAPVTDAVLYIRSSGPVEDRLCRFGCDCSGAEPRHASESCLEIPEACVLLIAFLVHVRVVPGT